MIGAGLAKVITGVLKTILKNIVLKHPKFFSKLSKIGNKVKKVISKVKSVIGKPFKKVQNILGRYLATSKNSTVANLGKMIAAGTSELDNAKLLDLEVHINDVLSKSSEDDKRLNLSYSRLSKDLTNSDTKALVQSSTTELVPISLPTSNQLVPLSSTEVVSKSLITDKVDSLPSTEIVPRAVNTMNEDIQDLSEVVNVFISDLNSTHNEGEELQVYNIEELSDIHELARDIGFRSIAISAKSHHAINALKVLADQDKLTSEFFNKNNQSIIKILSEATATNVESLARNLDLINQNLVVINETASEDLELRNEVEEESNREESDKLIKLENLERESLIGMVGTTAKLISYPFYLIKYAWEAIKHKIPKSIRNALASLGIDLSSDYDTDAISDAENIKRFSKAKKYLNNTKYYYLDSATNTYKEVDVDINDSRSFKEAKKKYGKLYTSNISDGSSFVASDKGKEIIASDAGFSENAYYIGGDNYLTIGMNTKVTPALKKKYSYLADLPSPYYDYSVNYNERKTGLFPDVEISKEQAYELMTYKLADDALSWSKRFTKNNITLNQHQIDVLSNEAYHEEAGGDTIKGFLNATKDTRDEYNGVWTEDAIINLYNKVMKEYQRKNSWRNNKDVLSKRAWRNISMYLTGTGLDLSDDADSVTGRNLNLGAIKFASQFDSDGIPKVNEIANITVTTTNTPTTSTEITTPTATTSEDVVELSTENLPSTNDVVTVPTETREYTEVGSDNVGNPTPTPTSTESNARPNIEIVQTEITEFEDNGDRSSLTEDIEL